MVITAINRVKMHIFQHIMHPSHVPLERKAEATNVGRARDQRPCRRFLRNSNRPRYLTVDRLVELAQKIDRLQMLAPTILIRHPLTGWTHVIQVEHRGHRVNTQAINMILAQPKERTADQEIPDLAASIVKDLRSPLFMLTFARVGIFIEVRAIKIAQRVAIFRKVRRYPVQQYANTLLMHIINKILEIFG